MLDFAKANPNLNLDILIRDWSEAGLEQGKKLADKLNLQSINYQRGNAFSRDFLSEIAPGLSICIVSGLYELFPDNTLIQESLEGLSKLVKPGGYLIYTNQPWHPQLEFIAEVLINREMQLWIMRRRTQAEMDELVSAAGFEKIKMKIDDWGIFTVSLARRKST